MNHRHSWLVIALIVLASAVTLVSALAVPGGATPPGDWRGGKVGGAIALHVVGDVLVWSALRAVPILLAYLLLAGKEFRDTQVNFPSLKIRSALLFWLCGDVFLFDVVGMWRPVYWQSGIAKLIAGVVAWSLFAKLWSNRAMLVATARAMHRAYEAEEAEGERL